MLRMLFVNLIEQSLVERGVGFVLSGLRFVFYVLTSGYALSRLGIVFFMFYFSDIGIFFVYYTMSAYMLGI